MTTNLGHILHVLLVELDVTTSIAERMTPFTGLITIYHRTNGEEPYCYPISNVVRPPSPVKQLYSVGTVDDSSSKSSSSLNFQHTQSILIYPEYKYYGILIHIKVQA